MLPFEAGRLGATGQNTGQEHTARFYRHENQLLDVVGGYLNDALRAGEVALVAATRPHVASFEASMRAAGVNVGETRRTGRFVVLDAEETLARILVEQMPDERCFEEVIGGAIRRSTEHGRQVRAYGEMVNLLWEQGLVAAALRLEDLWNELVQDWAFSLLCGYAIDPSSGESDESFLHEVALRHTSVEGRPTRPGSGPARWETARDFPAALNAPRAARRFVVEMLEGWGLAALGDEAAMVVSELATNSVLHARSRFTVTISARGNVARISVRDDSDRPPVRCRVPPMAQSGRGLAIVAETSKRWGVEQLEDGKVVWVELTC